MKKILWTLVVIVTVFVIALIGGSFYMLDFSLAPDPNRMDTDSCYRQQFETYPESKEWVDSLRSIGALRDTFMTMPTGERHHAFFVDRGSTRTALVVHGWRDCAIKFFWLARIYEHELGYNVVMPELHACGESEGDAIQMGWKDRLDVLHWMKTFQADTMVVHGVSMGAATTMMMSGEKMPEGIKDLRFVEDCGYTCVWDEFANQLNEQFGLPPFPLMYSASLLCQLRYGWSFGEASALEQVKKCSYPMLFIHGSADTFVSPEMVYPAEVPFGIVATKIVFSEGRRRITCAVETIFRIGSLNARDGFRHDAISAVSELFDTPELFVSASIGRNSRDLTIGSSSEGAVSTFDGDLEIRIAEISASLVNWGDGPTLMGTVHIVPDAGRDSALRPCADNIC